MFSLYNFIMVTLFVYFALFLHTFALFFEDLFLIIAFILFLVVIFQLIATGSTTYFAERANYIRLLYAKLFIRRKEAITKNKLLIKQLYLEQDNNIIPQYAALFYLKHAFNIKVFKEIEIKAQQTAAQSLFIEKQQQLTTNVRDLLVQPKHMQIIPYVNRKYKKRVRIMSNTSRLIPGIIEKIKAPVKPRQSQIIDREPAKPSKKKNNKKAKVTAKIKESKKKTKKVNPKGKARATKTRKKR